MQPTTTTTPTPAPLIRIAVAAGERGQVEFQLACRERAARVRWLGRWGATVIYEFAASEVEKVRAAVHETGVSVERSWRRDSCQG